MSKKSRYVGIVVLRQKGKIYGAKASQVNAKNVAEVRRILKKRLK